MTINTIKHLEVVLKKIESIKEELFKVADLIEDDNLIEPADEVALLASELDNVSILLEAIIGYNQIKGVN